VRATVWSELCRFLPCLTLALGLTTFSATSYPHSPSRQTSSDEPREHLDRLPSESGALRSCTQLSTDRSRLQAQPFCSPFQDGTTKVGATDGTRKMTTRRQRRQRKCPKARALRGNRPQSQRKKVSTSEHIVVCLLPLGRSGTFSHAKSPWCFPLHRSRRRRVGGVVTLDVSSFACVV
jgi:hypothetical protein